MKNLKGLIWDKLYWFLPRENDVIITKSEDTCVEKETKEDMVNRPSHYNHGGIECIDAIKSMLGDEGFIAYCRGNAIKYQWRSGLKFNSEEDMEKSVWYTRMANGDDPRIDPADPNKALKNAASLYHKALDDGTLQVDGPPEDAERGNNYMYWSTAARLAGWTPPPEREPDK